MKKYTSMNPAQKSLLLVDWLHEHKGHQIVSLPLAASSNWAEFLIIVSATSVRHAQSLADGLRLWCKEQKMEFLGREGYQAGQWILVDLNDIVVNIFQNPVRELYRLESLWADAAQAALRPTEQDLENDTTN